MGLGLIIVGLLVLALALVQAWTIWMLRREVARLEHRLSEALDDEDLLEFQDRLQGLLNQVREAGLDAVENVDRRQQALEEVLNRAHALELEYEDLLSKPGKAASAGRKPAGAPRKAAASPSAKPSPVRSQQNAYRLESQSAAEEQVPRKVQAARNPVVPTRNQRVYDLADQGLNREQIAKSAGLLPGEVELILNLRRQKPRN